MIGPPGVGKTSVLEVFRSTDQAAVCIYEDLTQIEEARRFWSENVATRTYLLQTAYSLYAYNAIRGYSSTAKIAISDFSLLFHHFGYSAAFRRASLLTDLEYNTLASLLSAFMSQLPPLVGIVHCTAESQTLYTRIQFRGRKDEAGFSHAFLNELGEAAATLVALSSLPVLTLELDRHNPASAAAKITEFIDNLGGPAQRIPAC